MPTGFDQPFINLIIKKITIPESTLASWQESVDLMVEAIGVPVGLIVQGYPRNKFELLVRNQNTKNAYLQIEGVHLDIHHYSGVVITSGEELLVPNALKDPRWSGCQAAKRGMISCLGVPLTWPDGTVFGAICVLDDQENHYCDLYRRCLSRARDFVEMSLRALYDEQLLLQHKKQISLLSLELERERKEGEERVRVHTEEMKSANEVLRESEARFRTLVDHALEAMIVVDLDSMAITGTNNRAEHLFGLNREELLKPGPARITPLRQPDGVPSSEAVLIQVSKSVMEGVNKFEWTHCNADGIKTLCEVHLVRLPSVGCNLVRASIIDITERKKAEEALAKIENQFRGIFANSAMGVIILDLEGRFVSCNPAFCDMIGYQETELTSMRFSELTCPQDIPISIREFNELLNGKREYYQFEKRYITKKGGIVWVRLTVSRIGTIENLSDFALAMVEDVTKQRNAEQALQQSEERYRTIFDNISDGLSVHDFEGRFLEVNAADCAIHGYSKEEMLALKVSDIVHPDYLKVFHEFKTSIKKTGFFQGEVAQFRKDGRLINIEVKGTTINLENKEYFLGIVRDITERKRVDEELRQYREHLEELVEERTVELASSKKQAEAANRAKSNFLANMSHELRTPLNVILGFSQLMQRDSSLADSSWEKLNIINRSGEHLLGLINDVLEISKIEAGHVSLDRTPFDFYRLLEGVEAMFEARAEQKGVRFSVEKAAHLPRYLIGDDGKLRQVLINLCGNAVKFTDKGGITVRVSTNGSSLPYVGKRDRRPWTLLFEVEDTGVGVSPEEMNMLFKPFEQGLNGQLKGGSGLGLAISRQYAHLMGGGLSVVSELGKGSLFTFSCRLEECREEVVEGGQVVRRVMGLASVSGPKTVLVVDDKTESRQFLAELLSSVGFAIREAVNGKEALAVYDAEKPDLVLMDMRMPVMDGYETTRRLKATASGKMTPIIAVSASAFGEERDEILATGADEFICKPFRENEIFEAIGSLLGIEYRYAEGDLLSPILEKTIKMTPSDLDALPKELKKKLRHALLALNVDAIRDAIDQICSTNQSLGEAMGRLEREYQFEMLLDLVNK